jgi:hypothetical protein
MWWGRSWGRGCWGRWRRGGVGGGGPGGGRGGGGGGGGWGGALHPLVLYYTVMALSHIPDMAAGTWAIAFALMWRRERRLWQAVMVGLLLGAAVMIRYTNVLLILPLAVVAAQCGCAKEAKRGAWLRDVGMSAAVFAAMVVPLAIYQAVAFGGVLRTGYSAGGNAMSFSWGWLVAHAPAMGAILWQPGTGLSVLLLSAVAGIGVMAVRGRWALVLLLAWAIPPLVLYTAYYGMPARNTLLYARFALCGFVPLILLGTMWPVWAGRRRVVGTAGVTVIAAMAIGLSALSPFMARQLKELNNQMLFAYSTRDIVRKDVPAGSIVVADDFTYYFLDYVGDYTIYNPTMFQASAVRERVADLTHSPREFDPARTRQLAALFGGKSDGELNALLRSRLRDAVEKGRGVYLVTLEGSAGEWAEELGAKLEPMDADVLSAEVYRVTFLEGAATGAAPPSQ